MKLQLPRLRQTQDVARFGRENFSSGGFNKWVLILSITLLALFSFVAWFLQRQFPTIEAEQSLTSNLGFFLLINLNIVVVLILGFLVVKNVIKLSLDRRRKILGAKLRTRLVVAFVGLSLIPTVLLFSVAKGIVERVLQGWFSPQVEASVDGALQVASLYYDESERKLRHFSTHLSGRLTKIRPYLFVQEPSEELLQATRHYLEEKRKEYGLFELALYSTKGRLLLRARSPAHAVSQPAINQAVLRKAQKSIQVNAEQSLTAEFLRAYSLIYRPSLDEDGLLAEEKAELQSGLAKIGQTFAEGEDLILVATQWVGPEISSSLASVISAHDDYRELRTYRRPLASSYFLTLVIVTLLIIFAAVWVGFYLARGISVPIGLLAEATQQVAHGNLGYRIPEVGDDELSVLVRSFNTMTGDLKETTGELVERRRYMETLLAQVGVGVISLDLNDIITTCNESARCLLGSSEDCLDLSDSSFASVAPTSIVKAVEEMREQLDAESGPSSTISSNIAMEGGDGASHIHLSLTTLLDEKGIALGYVLLLDNISDLVSAQRMAAWREVARRIAHEIKNPLTPIQLSAQRIQRRLSGSGEGQLEDRQLILDATSTIITQVESLRNLVNEFSRFARMPKTIVRTCDIEVLLNKVVSLFSEAHPGIEFLVDVDDAIEPFPFDEDQISRVLTNLIDNSISAINDCAEFAEEQSSGEKGRVVVSAILKEELSMVSVSVLDNGIGVAKENKPRLFEPYFSTKQSGTGLGLAIVSTIIADHRGYIRVADFEPRGTKITFELPIQTASLQLPRKQSK